MLKTETGAGGASATICFAATDHPDVMEQFPHPFVLALTYTLCGRSLRCEPVVTNHGADLMPFGLGFHPYLLAPTHEQIEVRLTPAARLWQMENWLATGAFKPAEGLFDLSTWQPLHATLRGEGYALTGAESDRGSRFELANQTSGLRLSLSTAQPYRHWLVFTGFEHSVSPEPYTCMTNAFNLDLDPAVSGMDQVGPGEVRQVGDWNLTWDWS